MSYLYNLLKQFLALLLTTTDKYVGNFGVSIIIVTILIKIMLLPLTLKQDKSMKEMKKLQPELEKIKKWLKDVAKEYLKNMTVGNHVLEAKFAAMCSLDKNTNIVIADNIIHSFAALSFIRIEERMAIFTKTFARIPSSNTKSLGRANFLTTSFVRKLSWVR